MISMCSGRGALLAVFLAAFSASGTAALGDAHIDAVPSVRSCLLIGQDGSGGFIARNGSVMIEPRFQYVGGWNNGVRWC